MYFNLSTENKDLITKNNNNSHNYHTKSSLCFKESRFKPKKTDFAVTLRGPHLSNKMLDNDTKVTAFSSLFQRAIK